MHAMRARGHRTVVLPVVWTRAAELVLAEARAMDASLVLMSGVAHPRQPLWIESGATNARAPRADVEGTLPEPTPDERDVVSVSIDTRAAHRAAERAFASVRAASHEGVRLDEILHGIVVKEPRIENAYICNDTTYRVTRALAGSPMHVGFFHWPSELDGGHIDAACHLLEEIARAVS